METPKSDNELLKGDLICEKRPQTTAKYNKTKETQ